MPKTESRFAQFDAYRSQQPEFGCKLCCWLRDAPPEDAAFISSLLAAPVNVKGHKHISHVLRDGGARISEDVVRRHRSHPKSA